MDTQAQSQANVFQLKGSMLAITTLELLSNDLDEVDRQLAKKVAQAPNFFDNTPLVISLEKLGADEGVVELGRLVRLCRLRGLRALAVRAKRTEDVAAAALLDIPILPASSAREKIIEHVEPELEPVPPVLQGSAARPTKIITTPVRGGQVIYAEGADLVVCSSVSPGAELKADGNIHVYGALKGRAFAGCDGNMDARIFCQQLGAEIVSVSGLYRVADDLRQDALWGEPVQINRLNDRLNITRL